MAIQKTGPTHLDTTNVADLLERVLDKGIVIAGDIKLKLLDIELLTIQIRLVVCSVDKAQEIGIDWWSQTKALCAPESEAREAPVSTVKEDMPEAAGLNEPTAIDEQIAALQEQIRVLERAQSGSPASPRRRPKAL